MTTTCIIASYNYGHLVATAIESVLCQTHKFDRIIVVDDGAHDLGNIKEIYADEPVEFLIRQYNMGTVANFQDILMNYVNTDKVMFLGADNYLRPDCLERLLTSDADIVSYDIALFGTEANEFAKARGVKEKFRGYPIWRFKSGDIFRSNYIHGSSLYNVALARSTPGYRPSGNRNSEEDWMLWRAMVAKGATHQHIQEPMLFYRRHKHNFIKLEERTV